MSRINFNRFIYGENPSKSGKFVGSRKKEEESEIKRMEVLK